MGDEACPAARAGDAGRQAAHGARHSGRRDVLLALSLAAITLAVFARALGNDFLRYYDDDAIYVLRNPHVTSGLTIDSVLWAFTSTYAANWHPLTWWSHQLDVTLFGLDPCGHHATSVLWHAANVVLLFVLLRWATGAVWQSALASILFAVHPLRVESAAWVAERKDVLSAWFWLATMLAYVRYARAPSNARYVLVAILYALGLMAKPMLVSLPFALLLLDHWPLARAARPRSLVKEKLPLIVLAAASCVVTVIAQRAGGAVASTGAIPLSARIGNALTAYVIYLQQMLWPWRVGGIYPHPGTALAWWRAVGAAILLAGFSIAVVRRRRATGALLFGWLWYLGTLVPVIGIIQVGSQAHADRYTYLPSIGLCIALVWGTNDLLAARRPVAERIAIAIAAGAIAALSVSTWQQIGYRKDSITAYRRALDLTPDNHVAYAGLGCAFAEMHRLDEAVENLRAAVRIKPDWGPAHGNLAIALAMQGRMQDARAELRRAWQCHWSIPEGRAAELRAWIDGEHEPQ